MKLILQWEQIMKTAKVLQIFILIFKKKSGKHLILKLRHTFSGERHKVLMEVAKLERDR